MPEISASSEMRGVYISTYGCQMNVNDSERMYTLLEMQNYNPVVSPEMADLIILNSCSVREKPVHKIHSEVGRYKKLKSLKPNLKIGVGGCVGQQEKKALLRDIPILDFVFGPDNIDELPQLVDELDSGERVARAKFHHQEPYQIQTLVRNPGVSTFVNITKGCDNFCTFCVVPFTRGRLRSRDDQEIVDDIKRLVDRGVKEITLLGQNVNSYSSSRGMNFSSLLRRLAKESGIERIRYTTSHPKDFDQELVDTMAEFRPQICDYIHLPVQSGNSEVLEKMNRGYTREDYLKKARMILDGLPGVSFSTDLIVGFPGETHEQYLETLSLLDEVPYESIYAFKYSPRPFTKAARWEDQVTEEEKSRRLTELIEKHRKIAFNLAKTYPGKVLNVLVESKDERHEGVVTGRSTQNKVVHFKGEDSLIGETVPVRITKAFPSTLYGDREQT